MLDLTPFGYAPGGYSFRCVDCSDADNLFGNQWAAKRAWRCEKHAKIAYALHLEWPPAPPAPRTMDFNVNYYVRVKLNDIGLAELKRQHDELRERVPAADPWQPPATDEEGYSKHQLWSLMYDLGHLCGLGRQCPFETNIQIILDQK